MKAIPLNRKFKRQNGRQELTHLYGNKLPSFEGQACWQQHTILYERFSALALVRLVPKSLLGEGAC